MGPVLTVDFPVYLVENRGLALVENGLWHRKPGFRGLSGIGTEFT